MKIQMHTADMITVQVPFRLVKRGGRKEMVLPEGATPKESSGSSTVVKALARAFRWKKMIESGAFTTIGDLAAHEKIAPTYMTRVMRLTLLAPEIVEGIVQGRLGNGMGLADLLEPFPAEWKTQASRSKEADAAIRL
ncbi:MAG: hypothetical protein ACOH2H_07260 [Cypionkella sp.]